ncbi:hypothetical protein ACFWY9_11945 [Amycolatopsis sp. NPDC059027]|uniref:hypothetical protein n=1 Tax=unclassified Amycolatopsis TaxID=2618356 RepID=UPI00367007E9
MAAASLAAGRCGGFVECGDGDGEVNVCPVRRHRFVGEHDDQELTLGALDQNVIDRWVTTGGSMRYEARHFLCWATERRLVSKVEVPVRPKNTTGYRALEADERWSLLHRLWHDGTIPLDIRVGGSLVILFGQHLSRIVRLTIDRIADDDHFHCAPSLFAFFRVAAVGRYRAPCQHGDVDRVVLFDEVTDACHQGFSERLVMWWALHGDVVGSCPVW